MTDCHCHHTDAAHGPNGCQVMICPCRTSRKQHDLHREWNHQ